MVSHPSAKRLSSSRRFFTHRYQDILYRRGLRSTVHCSGPLSAEVDFADQSVAEENQDALVEALDLDPLSAQSLAHLPGKIVDVDICV